MGGACVDVVSQLALRNAAHLRACHPESERSDPFAGQDYKCAGGLHVLAINTFCDQASMPLEDWGGVIGLINRARPRLKAAHYRRTKDGSDMNVCLDVLKASPVRPDFFAARGDDDVATLYANAVAADRGLTLLVVGSATPDGRKGLFAVPAARGGRPRA